MSEPNSISSSPSSSKSPSETRKSIDGDESVRRVKPDKVTFNHVWKLWPGEPGSAKVHCSERFPEDPGKLHTDLVCWLEAKWTTVHHIRLLLMVGSTEQWRCKCRVSLQDLAGVELHVTELSESTREATSTRLTVEGLPGQYFISMPMNEWLSAKEVAEFSKAEDKALKVI